MKLICELNDKMILGQEGRSNKAPRLTARAIVKNQDGLYAVMYADKFKFHSLPGGGVEPGETHEAYILRECLEETGFLVQVGELLGSAESYLMHEKIGAFHPVQHYYAGAFLEFVCAPVELDHTLVWLPCEKAAEQMNVEQQAWAVRKALEKLAWMKEHIE